MKSFALGAAAVTMVALSAPASAVTVIIPPARVTYVGGTSTLPANLTPGVAPTGNPQAQQYDFDTQNPTAGTFSAGSGVFANSVDGVAARPEFNTGTGNFAAVLGGGTYTLNFGTAVQVLSFVVGSLDTYNSLTFTYSNGDTTTLNGYEIIQGSTAITTVPNSGNQDLAVTNGRVTYDLGGLSQFGAGITSVVFGSSANSFEFDQVATAAPEPGTWGMMIVGFGLAGGALRMRRRTKGLATA